MKTKIYLSILLSYLFIFLYPLCFSMFSYNQAIEVVKDDSQESTLSSLKRCCDMIDGRLMETKVLTDQISNAASTDNLVYSENPDIDPRTIVKMMDFSDKLKASLYPNNFVNDVFVYFKGPKLVVGSNETYFNYSQFYDAFFHYADMTPDSWNQLIEGIRGDSRFLPSATIMRYQKADRMLVYLKGFPDYTGSKGTIVTLIPESKIISAIKDTYLEEYGWFRITDAKGKTVLSYKNGIEVELPPDIELEEGSGSRDITIDGRKYLLSSITSPYNGWNYIGMLPYSAVMKKADGLYNTTLMTTSLCLMTGLAGVIILTSKKSKHVKNLANILTNKLNIQYMGRNKDIKLIDKSLSGLLDANASMKNNFQFLLPMLRNTFVEKLLKGELSSDEEIEWTLSQFNLPELAGSKTVVCAKIQSGDQPDMQNDLVRFNSAKLMLEDVFSRLFGSFYSYNANFNSNVYVIKLGNRDTDFPNKYLDEELNRICQSMYAAYDISIILSIGMVFENLSDAALSYNSANEAMDNNILLNNKNVLWYNDVKTGEDSFFYPIEYEVQLLNNLKEGNFKKVEYILDYIYKENYDRRKLSHFMAKSLINEIYSTLVKTNTILKLESDPEGKLVGELILKIERQHNSVEKIFKEYNSICRNICEIVGRAKNSNITSHKVDIIVRYVEANFSNLDLNLTTLADKFGFAPPYLSKIFKENTGENFSAYLENLRIKKGCELLIQCENIEEVSRKAGYNSINAFRKAFKSNMGITPSDYRFQQRRDESMRLME